MMEMAAWLFHGVTTAAVLLLGAAAWELAARWSGRPTRWAWLAALVGSVVLPFVLRFMPAPGWSEGLPAVLPSLVLEPVQANVGAEASGWGPAPVALLLWLAASLVMVGYVGWLVLRLQRLRRSWRPAELEGGRVWLTEDVGPAALGLWRGMVVMPAWVLELDADLRSLLLRHEREHVRAGDPRLLLAGLLLVALMPWNPLLWLQLARLRNGIELDCDARVLGSGVDPRLYGSLLLEVGRRRGAPTLVMATFSEPRLFLEERIRRIARWPLQRRPWRAAGFGALAVMLFATALSARDPLRSAAFDAQSLSVDSFGDVRLSVLATDTPPPSPRPGQRLDEAPTFTPMTVRPVLRNVEAVTRALQDRYPPLLRDAGIGGTTHVWFFITRDGSVGRTQMSRSSGYAALDSAALSVARLMEFTPARDRDEVVPVWVEIPIVFSPPLQPSRAEPPPARPSPEPTPVQAQPEPSPLPARPPPEPTRVPQQPELRNMDEVREALVTHYPPLLRDAGIGGSARVSLHIDEDGSVSRLHVLKSSGYDALDQAALGVAAIMQFKPGLEDGRRVAMWVEVPIVFAPPE
jgi:TonB family protein